MSETKKILQRCEIAQADKWAIEDLYATDEAISDGIDFYGLKDFSLVICKPDRKVIYRGCEWSSIREDGELDAMVAEKITVMASHRIETGA